MNRFITGDEEWVVYDTVVHVVVSLHVVIMGRSMLRADSVDVRLKSRPRRSAAIHLTNQTTSPWLVNQKRDNCVVYVGELLQSRLLRKEEWRRIWVDHWSKMNEIQDENEEPDNKLIVETLTIRNMNVASVHLDKYLTIASKMNFSTVISRFSPPACIKIKFPTPRNRKIRDTLYRTKVYALVGQSHCMHSSEHPCVRFLDIFATKKRSDRRPTLTQIKPEKD
ncbi:hypothetical protein WN51_12865 [Melipona quadrifasciata]|uniref:Uncharacterized protein n=1 Tax=Melipona quadrifasciata TaxID=166423 RepID=A0A0M9A1H7_9HYME|nr:hypothetical protein WN51_12865 [Melipona quadrifasciata]